MSFLEYLHTSPRPTDWAELVSISANLSFQPRDMWAQPGKQNIQEYIKMQAHPSSFKFSNVHFQSKFRQLPHSASQRIKRGAGRYSWMTGSKSHRQLRSKVRKKGRDFIEHRTRWLDVSLITALVCFPRTEETTRSQRIFTSAQFFTGTCLMSHQVSQG